MSGDAAAALAEHDLVIDLGGKGVRNIRPIALTIQGEDAIHSLHPPLGEVSLSA